MTNDENKSCATLFDHPEHRILVLTVYIGGLPVGMTTQHSPGGARGEAHGGTPTWGERCDVIVAIFNASLPGKRASGPRKQLDPMQVAGGTVFGNYFNMPAPAPYRIAVEILREGLPEVARATFNYTHALAPVRPPSPH